MKPPQVQLTSADIEKWKDEVEQLKRGLEDTREAAHFSDWVTLQQRKVAPGFDFDSIMKPSQNPGLSRGSSEKKGDRKSEGDELDDVFGRVNIGD